MRWVLPLLVCAFAPHSLLAEAASGWHVKIARHGTNQSVVSWNFVGAITNAGGVQWKAGVHSMGGFGISSPQTDLTGFYSGPSLSSPRFSDKGGFAHLTSGYEEPFIYVEITPTGVWLKHRSMQIMNSPFTRTPLPSGSVVMDIPFSAFGRGVYSPSTNTFFNAIEGGFETSLTVLSYNTDPPVIALIGSPAVTVFRGATFADEGANVTDDLDPPRTITGSGTVDTSTVGTYVLTYTTQDSYGNEATPVTRTVEVVLDPNGDEDNDGLNNTEEADLGTNPYLRDTDSDGVNDLREVGDGTDPLDPASFDSLSQGLVAYFPFDGDATDKSGFGLVGTVYGAIPAVDRFGNQSGCYSFNGVSSYIDFGSPSYLQFTGDFTATAWVQYTGGTLNPRVISNGREAGYELFFRTGATDKRIGVHAGAGLFLDSINAYEQNEWRLVTVVREGNLVSLYVNGRLDTSQQATFQALYSYGLQVGRAAQRNTDYWGGLIDEVRLYNRGLSPSEVALLYANDTYQGFGLEGAATKSPFDPATAANWSSGGTEWHVDTITTHDGVDSVKAQTTDGQSTYREYTIAGPAVVDFWWKVSSQQGLDTFSYSINSTIQDTISGEIDWSYRWVYLPSGTHTIRWTYTKDGSVAEGNDAAWLDNLRVNNPSPTGDEDNDGLNNTEEANLGTNPYLRDTDSDGVNDLREVGDKTDPLDPASFDSLSQGLVAYYPFSGNANDFSGNGLHRLGALGFAPDRFAVENEAVKEASASGEAIPPPQASSGRTITFWTKVVSYHPTNFSWPDSPLLGDRGAVQFGGALGDSGLGLTDNGYLWLDSGDGVAHFLVGTFEHWRQVSIVYEGSIRQSRVYVDGRLIALEYWGMGGKEDIDLSDATQFSMSAGDWSLDDLRIYNRALSASEVAGLYGAERYEGFGLEGAATKSPFDPATAANWSSGGTEWSVDTTTTQDGVDSVKAQTTDDQSTYREYTVTGPAVVDFWWKVSSEQLYDTFTYAVNGVDQETISGEVDWTYRTLTLPEGAHTIRWTYAKDGSDAVGQDAGWLDDFAVYPAEATLQVRDGETVLDGEVTVDFGDADIGSAGFTKSLYFTNEGYVPLEVELSLPADSPFTFSEGSSTYATLLGRGESLDIPIYLSTASAGTKSVPLSISSPESTVAPPSITLTGYVRGPEITLSVADSDLTTGQSFDMGLAPSTAEFTIRNTGVVGDLVISEISTTGNFQIAQQPTTTIPPSGSATFIVSAQNLSNGTQSGSISIESNAANVATFNLSLNSRALLANVVGANISSVRSSGDGGAVGWDFAPTLSPDGTMGTALKTGATPDNGQSHLQATFNGAGLLRWKWKLSAQEGFDWLACEVSGGSNPSTYTDRTNDTVLYSNEGALDIDSVTVLETATNIIFTITVNGNLAALDPDYAEFYIAIADGKRSGTTAGNAWGSPISLSLPVGGMTHWIGSWVGSSSGAILSEYNGAGWIASTSAVGFSTTAGSRSTLEYTVSKASLGFERGDVLHFDVYSSLAYYSAVGAVDALSNPMPTISNFGDQYTSSLATGVSRYPRGGEVVSVSTKNAVWREQAVYVPANGTVKWTYRKDASAAVGEDSGYITDLSFEPFGALMSYAEWWGQFQPPSTNTTIQTTFVTNCYVQAVGSVLVTNCFVSPISITNVTVSYPAPPRPQAPMSRSGLPAIMSWVGGFDPDSVPDSSHYRILQDGSQQRFRFPISKRYSGGSVSAEFTPSLTNKWSGAGVSQTLHSQDADTVIIEATPPAGTTKGFMRLNVR